MDVAATRARVTDGKPELQYRWPSAGPFLPWNISGPAACAHLYQEKVHRAIVHLTDDSMNDWWMSSFLSGSDPVAPCH